MSNDPYEAGTALSELRTDALLVETRRFLFEREFYATGGDPRPGVTDWRTVSPDFSATSLAGLRRYVDLFDLAQHDHVAEQLEQLDLPPVGDDDDRPSYEAEFRAAVQDLADDADHAPLMRYVYPLEREFSYEEARQLQARLLISPWSIIVVELITAFGSEHALALTGGGMDMTWDICGGYVVAGMLPPFAHCRLPNFAGQRATAANLLVRDAVRRSIEVVQMWARVRHSALNEISDALIYGGSE